MRMITRPLALRDVAALRAVIDATGLFPGALLDGMTKPYLAGDVEEEIWLTADQDGAPVALAYAAAERMTEGTWNMLLIAVHPERQRRGLGGALVAAVKSLLRARDARLLLVETSGLAEFDETRRFYVGLGFAQEGRIRDYYKRGEDKIIFATSLSAAAR